MHEQAEGVMVTVAAISGLFNCGQNIVLQGYTRPMLYYRQPVNRGEQRIRATTIFRVETQLFLRQSINQINHDNVCKPRSLSFYCCACSISSKNLNVLFPS